MHRGPRICTWSQRGGIAAVFLAVGVAPAPAGPLAYLSNLDEASVTVVDTTSLTETATIPLPGTPSAIVAGASGARVYVSYLNQSPSVTAQLVATNGSCWTSEFHTARRNDATHFSATSD